MMYAVLPYCTQGSMIVNIASVAAFQPVPFGAEYAASKAYVLALSRAVQSGTPPAQYPRARRMPLLDKDGLLRPRQQTERHHAL